MGWLNVVSLLLGLIAWVLPIVNLAKHNKAEHTNWTALSFASFSACAVALFFQNIYQGHLAKIEDFSAIMDTSGGLVVISGILVFITIMLNVMVLVKYRKSSDMR